MPLKLTTNRKTNMQKPNSVKHAEILIWVTLAVTSIVSIIELKMGLISGSLLVSTLLLNCVYGIIPYKIGAGSNAARYIYAVLCALGFALLVSDVVPGMPQIELVVAWVELPVTLYTLYLLFNATSKPWFVRAR